MITVVALTEAYGASRAVDNLTCDVWSVTS